MLRSSVTQPATGRLRPLLSCGFLLAAGIIAYHNSLAGPFVFDDNLAIVQNPYIRHLWPIGEAMRWNPESTVSARPIISLSLAFNYALGGLNVRGYHLFNLGVHLAAGLFLFGVLRRTFLLPRLNARYGVSGRGTSGIMELFNTALT